LSSRIWLYWLGVGAACSLGCAARAADDSRLIDELARSRQQALLGELRLAELERRLGELQREAPRQSAEAEAQRQILYRLDLLVAQNQHLLEQQIPAPEPPPAGAQASFGESPSSDAVCGEDVDPEEQLRRTVERLRQGPHGFRGGLTPEQNHAVNVLLRGRRTLDPSNPWSS
jgi:hypothetical protein